MPLFCLKFLHLLNIEVLQNAPFTLMLFNCLTKATYYLFSKSTDFIVVVKASLPGPDIAYLVSISPYSHKHKYGWLCAIVPWISTGVNRR